MRFHLIDFFKLQSVCGRKGGLGAEWARSLLLTLLHRTSLAPTIIMMRRNILYIYVLWWSECMPKKMSTFLSCVRTRFVFLFVTFYPHFLEWCVFRTERRRCDDHISWEGINLAVSTWQPGRSKYWGKGGRYEPQYFTICKSVWITMSEKTLVFFCRPVKFGGMIPQI